MAIRPVQIVLLGSLTSLALCFSSASSAEGGSGLGPAVQPGRRADVQAPNEATPEGDRIAAEKGSAAAQFELGLLYARGLGVAKDEEEAFRWLAKAARQGHPEACGLLAGRYTAGQVPRSLGNVFLYAMRRAADLGVPAAQRVLGLVYERGDFVPRNEARSRSWYVTAANSGDEVAQGIVAKFRTEEGASRAPSD